MARSGACPPSAATGLLPSVEPLRVSSASPLRSHGASILDDVDALGERLGAPKAERPQLVERQAYRLRRADVWPPEVLAEIQRIYAGEIE